MVESRMFVVGAIANVGWVSYVPRTALIVADEATRRLPGLTYCTLQCNDVVCY